MKKRVVKHGIRYFGNEKFIKTQDTPEELLKKCVDSVGTEYFGVNRNNLIYRYMPMCLSIASNYFVNERDKNIREDLVSVATLELIESVDNLIKKKLHNNISGYIHLCVKGSICNFLRDVIDFKRDRFIHLPDSEYESFEDINTNKTTNLILIDELMDIAKHAKFKYCDIDPSMILMKRIEGNSLEEISQIVYDKTGKRVTSERIRQMLDIIRSYVKNKSILKP